MHYFLLEYVRLFFHVWLERIQLLIVEKLDTSQISKITTQIFLATKYLLDALYRQFPSPLVLYNKIKLMMKS